MSFFALAEIILRAALLVGGLLIPGTLLLRALRLPWSLALAFVGSSVTLYLVVLVFAYTSAPISLFTLAGSLGVVSLALQLSTSRKPTDQYSLELPFFTQLGRWWPLYLIFWLIVGYRLIVQPLTGPDVYFRWSYLAEQMVQFGSLDFYPPRRAEDFVRYFWAESIPPGIASLYTWVYACGASKHALWTSPIIALQLLSLHEIIWRLAQRWGGQINARRAVLLAASCPLLTWSFVIGQETGYTALGVSGLVLCLFQRHQEKSRAWTILAAVFAGAVASTREYGPIFAVAALIAAWWLDTPRGRVLLLAAISLPLALAWPLRVWWLTGNPFYSLDVAGLFPTNAVFLAWAKLFHGPIAGTFPSLESGRAIFRYFLLWALPALLGVLALLPTLRIKRRETQVITWFVILVTVLWFVSVPHTAGGLFYSLRVMSPAFALLIVVLGFGVGEFARKPAAAKLFAAALILISIESWPKTLVLPDNPYRSSPKTWLAAGSLFSEDVREAEQKLFTQLLPLSLSGQIISDNAGLPRVLASRGIEVVPLWSPAVAWLFDRALAPETVAARWREAGFRHVLVGKGSAAFDFLAKNAQWRAPYFSVKVIFEAENYVVLEADTFELPQSQIR